MIQPKISTHIIFVLLMLCTLNIGDAKKRKIEGRKKLTRHNRNRVAELLKTGELAELSIRVVISGIKEIKSDVAFSSCADVEIVLDLSCSLSKNIKQRSRDIAMILAGALTTSFEPTLKKVRVGILTYGETTNQLLALDNSKTTKEVVDLLTNMNLKKEDTLCRTMTHSALKEVQTIMSLNKRKNTAQLVLLITDGLTFFRRHRSKLYKTRNQLKNDGVILNVISMPHRKGKFEEEEFEKLPHDVEQNFFNGSDPDVANAIMGQIARDAPCPITPQYSRGHITVSTNGTKY